MNLTPHTPETTTKRHNLDQPNSRWSGLLREPLLHFVVIGALIFGGYALLTPEQQEAAGSNTIVVTKDDIRQLAIAWMAQGRATPTPDQLKGLVDQKVTQEILVREAVALGLDRDDEVIKRRLAQKMDFLASDVAVLQEPTEAELKAWFERNAQRFALPPHASFRHLYFSPDKHGKAAYDAAAAALPQISRSAPGDPALGAVGDPFMFQNYYGGATLDQISKAFGQEFSEALFRFTPGKWAGPVRSGYGWHLVWVESTEPGRVPAFAEVAPSVKAAWIDGKYREIKRTALDEMRSRYVVSVPSIEAGDLRDLQVPPGFVAQTEATTQ